MRRRGFLDAPPRSSSNKANSACCYVLFNRSIIVASSADITNLKEQPILFLVFRNSNFRTVHKLVRTNDQRSTVCWQRMFVSKKAESYPQPTAYYWYHK